ncbi:MAG: ATP-dependent Clp protease proteolytic subunit [Capsulimonadales bacterium]|nr:ATP-dependent Clp protease proteolytic subunit [Capsulimonadales bacterium]
MASEMAQPGPGRLIFLGENPDKNVAEEVSAFFFLLDSGSAADIVFCLDCARGSVEAYLAIFDAMQLVEADIVTYCRGTASAATALLLCGGTPGKRYLHPATRISLLPVTARFDNHTPEAAAITEAISQLTDSLAFLIAQNTGRSQSQVKAALESGLQLSAEEAIAFGLADGLLTELPEGADEVSSPVLPSPVPFPPFGI